MQLCVHPVFHTSKLKRYEKIPAEFGPRTDNRPPPTIVAGQQEWEVEDAIGERTRRGKREILVK